MIFIGAGGHAKVIADILASRGVHVGGYIDKENQPWIEQIGYSKIEEKDINPDDKLIMGFGGVRPDSLARRYHVMMEYVDNGFQFPEILHQQAYKSVRAYIGYGTQIFAGACINSNAHIGNGCIINTGAIVEHDAEIGSGTHIAPGAIVLGGAKIGKCCMIGAGSVIIQGTTVEDNTFVRALSYSNQR